MLQAVLDYLNIKLQTMNIFTELYSLCEKIFVLDGTGEDQKKIYFPAYMKNGEFTELKIDQTPALVYHLLNGKPQRGIVPETVGGRPRFQHDIPMRMVCFIQTDRMKQNDAFSAYTISQSIMTLLTETNNKTLRQLLKASSVSISPASTELNPEVVWGDQFTGRDYELPDRVILLSIDYSISITASVDCVPVYSCGNSIVDVKQVLIDNICPGVQIFNSNDTLLTVVPAGGSFTIPFTSNMKFTFATLPASGNIIDAAGIVVGTLTSVSEIHLTPIENLRFDEFEILVNERPLLWMNGVDADNDIDLDSSTEVDNITCTGDIILFAGREQFQEFAQIRILYKY